MAEKILEQLNELDSGSVTPQEFQKVWGISKEEYLSRMMDYVHKRKAEAAEKEKNDDERELLEQMVELRKQVADLKDIIVRMEMEINLMKKVIASQVKLPSFDSINGLMQYVNEPKATSKKSKKSLFDDNSLFRLFAKGDNVFFSPVTSKDWETNFLTQGPAHSCFGEEEFEDALAGGTPKKRKK